ncbi:helix-turn-helix transcriptional regulator [Primorskyibacter flagellatus]|uniref:Helix-turn-helix transcriptional regulator n=1 Tax=Primorskyibacter flagellatus TaxID=1387277 RepID=A0A917A6Y0_9RHOB|nr:alpha/beta fold hydrolase [Primorskyibacter flagellatus]GGE31951.1 helix-turn-helix transcriptional regulator [Primorskyibacter flagellatus]
MTDPTKDQPAPPGADHGDPALQSEVVDRLYGAALEPEKLGDLIDHWDALMSPGWRSPAPARRAMIERTGLLRHVRRVEQILDRVRPGQGNRAEEAELRPYRNTAAFTLDGALRVSAMNRAASKTLGAALAGPLSCLRVREEDLAVLARVALAMLRRDGAGAVETSRLIRARRLADDRLVLLQTRLVQTGGQADFVLVVTTELHWPEGAADTLRAAFGLTRTEAEVMMALTESRTLRDIAASRGRSVDTIRSQIKAIQTKTEARGQNDLLRLAMTAMDIAPLEARGTRADAVAEARVARGGTDLPPLPFRSLPRPEGRVMDYLEFGDPRGRPVVYFCSNFGLCRWPGAAERAAVRAGLRIVVPIRPGMGGSDPLGKAEDRTGTVARDILALMDHLGIGAAHMLVLDEDMIFAARLFMLAPKRVRGVLGVAAVLPLTRREQYERMGRWHRFVLGTARFTPQMLPVLVRAGFAMARHIGRAEFIRLVYAGSEADTRMTRDPMIFDAIDSGADVVLSDTRDSARAYGQEVSAVHRFDWRREFEQMRDRVPVIDLIGDQDQAISAATLAEFREDYPWVEIEVFAGAGSFLFFQKWPEILRRLERFMDGDVPALTAD